uniref:FMRFamide-like neuropeptide FLP6 n=2 Tax=Penaeus TaxID=133894 RepID=FAR6_PENMO|nr:RecName: Full=FMRFamide-like neuropeptide FLP6; AltName: Full=DGRTPALRLRF-amide [Penaeus monodon]
DGRTPALRLRF